MSDLSERTFWRNTAMLLTDSLGFSVGQALLGSTTILPTVVRLLGGSPVAVGLIGAIQTGGFFLPQLIGGRYVAGRALVKRYVVIPAGISRVCLLILPFALLLLAPLSETLALAAVLLTYAAFNVIDALSAVGYFDLLAKAIPVRRRGRVMGAGQSLSALLAVVGGVLVTEILARPRPFPQNHALVLLLGAGFLAICPLAMALIREPRGTVDSEMRLGWGDYLPRLGSILRRDQRFRWLAAMMWLGGLGDMASTFYVLYAGERVGIPEATIGLFISAGVAGSFVAGVLLGPLGDRKGSAAVIRVVMSVRCLAPILALLTPLVAGWAPWAAVAAFMLVFALTGMASGSFMIGYMNYMLEIAPDGERPMYVALANACYGLLVVAPPLAGLLASVSYELLFVVALVCALAGLVVALRSPRVPAVRGAGVGA